MSDFLDSVSLASFQQKLQLIRDRTEGVAKRYYTAAYLVGRPGTSKTYTAVETLSELGVPHIVRNARMTPMGLFDLLCEHPEHVIVLDDIATVFNQPIALQILMAALDGDANKPRLVTYKSKDQDISFPFSGSIIAISNVPLRQDPLAKAVASRVVQLEHEPSDEEIAAFMRHLAFKGYKDLTPTQCREVVDFVIQETRSLDQRLDLRHLSKGYEDRRQWEHGNAATDWRDLVRTSMKKTLCEQSEPISKAEEIEQQRQKVKEAIRRFPNDSRKQMDFCGLGRSTFYARRRELSC